jgi:hypothetical protein
MTDSSGLPEAVQIADQYRGILKHLKPGYP